MRNLVIGRLTDYLVRYPDLMVTYDISVQELDNLSNMDLLELFEEMMLELGSGS